MTDASDEELYGRFETAWKAAGEPPREEKPPAPPSTQAPDREGRAK